MCKKSTALLLALALLCAVAALPPALAEESRQVIFYWQAEGVNYDTCDMWIWFPGKDGRGYLFEPCDYGVRVALEVPSDISRVGFIVRKACSDPGGSSWGSATKDYDGDRFVDLTGQVTEVYLKEGDKNLYLSDDGGKTLFQERKLTMAGITAMNQIQYFLTPATRISSLDQVQVTVDGEPLEILSLSSLDNQVVTGTITLAEDLDLSRNVTVSVAGYDPVIAVPTAVFDSPAFVERFAYGGEDLGATLTDSGTHFKVWAPTASRVQLRLYADGEGGDRRAP